MENASKAILMAGGMLLTILIVSLLVFAWNTFSNYYSQKDSIDEIDDVTEFNLQFTNYDRNDVSGYELLSLINQVIDYNMRKSTAAAAPDVGRENNQNFPPITIIINMNDSANEISSPGRDLILFEEKVYRQDDTHNMFASIIEEIERLKNNPEGDTNKIYGATNLQNMSKRIKYIYMDNEREKDVVQTVNSITSEKLSVKDEIEINKSYKKIMDSEENVRKYYEYVQFKKATFESNSTSIQYDLNSGRIISMEFTYKKP